MSELTEYVIRHTRRGDCKCGKCCDLNGVPDPTGHTVDMVFFVVSAVDKPTLEIFTSLTRSHRGEFCECDPFDGKEHSYLEIGGWIGDQGLAMQYMALGVLLGAWALLSPSMFTRDKDLQLQLAGSGFLNVLARPAVEATA